jgi:ATP-dependent helicase HepA
MARTTAERLVLILARSTSAFVSSSNVESLTSVTSLQRRSATFPWICDSSPPPRGRRSTLPVSRSRRSNRLTLARPTPSRAAISSYELPSSLRLRTASRSCRGSAWSIQTVDHGRRISSSGIGFSPAFANEASVLEEALRSIEAADPSVRVNTLVAWLAEDAPKKKCVIFVDDPSVAQFVCRELRGSLGQGVVAWSGDKPKEEEDGDTLSPIRSFEELDVRVLVCDREAEEGTNLQKAATIVVHYDLPMSPARLEQRIGRTDRLDARNGLRLLCFAPEGAYEQGWHRYLDTIGVFRASVAPLQYVLAESVERLRGLIPAAGAEAFEVERRRLADPKAGLKEELRRIREQDFLDAVESDPTEEEAAVERIGRVEELARTGSEAAFDSWVVDRLFFKKTRRAPVGVDYVYVVDRTRLPLMDVYDRFQPFVDLADPHRRKDHMPLGPFSFSREECEDSDSELLRVGHPFVATLEALLRADDRGAAFAMWRVIPTWAGPPALFFRFEFLLEANLTGRASSASPTAREALRRTGIEAFPIQHRTVWLDGGGNAVIDPHTLQLLARPYDQKNSSDGAKDQNVRLERWDHADKSLPLSNWERLCREVRGRAESVVLEDPELKRLQSFAVQAVQRQADDVQGILATRVAHLSGRLRQAEEADAKEAALAANELCAGIRSPLIRLDSVGCVYLAGERLAGNEE